MYKTMQQLEKAAQAVVLYFRDNVPEGMIVTIAPLRPHEILVSHQARPDHPSLDIDLSLERPIKFCWGSFMSTSVEEAKKYRDMIDKMIKLGETLNGLITYSLTINS
jgi:hypothetical protein